MKSAELHTMARRYLMDRTRKLYAQYAALPAHQDESGRYTDEAQRIFPRYHLTEALLLEVERLDPDHLPAPEPLAAALATAATNAQSAFTRPPLEPIRREAVDAERDRFRTTLRTWLSSDADVEPLPYRRVLTDDEAAVWRGRLHERWGVVAHNWHPLISDRAAPEVLVFDDNAMWDGPGVRLVHEALADLGRPRVFEWLEDGVCRIVDTALAEPRYTGLEGVWTDETLDWIAYASHELTITFGGTLADRVRDGLRSYEDQSAK